MLSSAMAHKAWMEMTYAGAYYLHTIRKAKKARPLTILPTIWEYRECGCGENDEDLHELVHESRSRYEFCFRACVVAKTVLSLCVSTFDINVIWQVQGEAHQGAAQRRTH